MPVQVKICGLTRRDDALAAVEAGADLIGVIFFPGSKRFVPFDEAAAWLGEIPRSIARVGVFVDAAPEEIREIVDSGLIDLAQLHGAETPAQCQALGVPYYKGARVGTREALDELDAYGGPLILVDSPEPGSGRPLDPALATEAVRRWPQRNILLAGGLTPESVGSVIRSALPWGVDVATGVESAPGIKDPAKVRKFIAEAKAAAIVRAS